MLIVFLAFGQSEGDYLNFIDCHDDIIEQKIKHAVAEDDCENCHMANGNAHPQEGVKGFELGDEVPALCFMCHDENTKSNIHPPSEEGECLTCHSPHSSANKGLLINAPQAALCFDCHDASIAEKQFKHKPVAEGNCSNCHDPHQSEYDQLLKAEKKLLCLSCHTSAQMQMEFSSKHVPFEDDCANCHETHSADHEKLLLQKTPELCFNCHDNPVSEEAKSIHKVVTEGTACANCHNPHASKEDMLLTKAGKDLCLSCHSKSIKTEKRTVANIGQLLKKGNMVHGIIELDGCAVCHNAHASEFQALLNSPFPEDTYTAASVENFELCFMCHDPELMLLEKTTSATNFRNGDQNMHYLHMNGSKSRNCIMCHNVHGSSSAHLIADKVKFGNWDMPIDYKVNDNGGSCNTGCHAEKKYIR